MTAMPICTQYARCTTPTQDCEESTSSAMSEEDIPHLLKPNPSDSYGDEDEVEDEQDQEGVGYGDECDANRFLVQGFPSPHGNHEMMNESPISSLTAYTRGERSVISTLTNLLPPVTPSSRESSRSSSSRSSSKQGKTTSSGSRNYNQHRYGTPPSPIDLTATDNLSARVRGRSHLSLKVKTREEYASLSPVHVTSSNTSSSVGGDSVTKSRGSSVRSSRSSHQRTKSNIIQGCETFQFLSLQQQQQPLATPVMSNVVRNVSNGSHRRSTSLNLPSFSHSSSASRRRKGDSGLWTLREGSQVDDSFRIPAMPITYCPMSCDLGATRHHSNATHRRTVSFPDHVLGRTGNVIQKRQGYNDVLMESDDPALFSLIETTQARRDGRVFIASDVDPFLATSSSFASASPSSTTESFCEDKRHIRDENILVQELKRVGRSKKCRNPHIGKENALNADCKSMGETSSPTQTDKMYSHDKSKISGVHTLPLSSSKGLNWRQSFPITPLSGDCIVEEDVSTLENADNSFHTFPSHECEKEQNQESYIDCSSPARRKVLDSSHDCSRLYHRHSINHYLNNVERKTEQVDSQQCCIIQ